MAPPQKSPTPTVQGFGKVLTSIQGLQQRLEDFSLEEVSRAETDAKNLIHQLSALRTKLQCLAELKAFVVSACALINEIPSENFDQVAPDGLENHPQLHAIVQASKLIRFHRIMKAAKAGAEAISFDADAGVLNFATATPHEPVRATEVTLSQPPVLESAHLSAPPLEAPRESVRIEPANTGNESTKTVEEREWVFSSAPENPHAAVTEHVFDLAAPHPRISETSELIGKPQTGASAEGRETPSIKTKGTPQPGIHFDQRLLSDLIETYGEFTEAAKLPAVIEAPQAAKSESREFQMVDAPVHVPKPTKKQAPKPQTFSKSVVQLPQPTEGQTLPAPLTSVQPTETKSPEPLMIHAPNPSATKPVEKEQRVLTVRRHGELDRQLKSIIKDYGEYDLYSHRSTINFKTAAIAAFVVLGLVLGGFYFFRVPTVPTPAAVTAGQPGGLSDGAKTATGSRTADTSNSNKTK